MTSTHRSILVFAFCALLLGFPYLQGRYIDASEHTRFSLDLQRARTLETQLNQDVLQSRYGMQRNYDAIVSDLLELRALRSTLAHPPHFVAGDGRDAYDRMLHDYVETSRMREALAERFKSANALLRNSSDYFPVVTRELLVSLERQPRGERELVRELRDVVLGYQSSPDASSRERLAEITRALEAIPPAGRSLADRERLQRSIDHGRNVVEKKTLLDGIVAELMQLPASERLDALQDGYLAEYNAGAARDARYRLALYLFGLVALAIVALVLRRLRAAGLALNQANQELERRVEERTREVVEKTRQISEGEARARAVLETAVDGILTIDESGTIESINPAALRMFGWDESQVIGRNVRMLMPEPYHSEHDRYLDNYRRTHQRRVIGIGREVSGQRRDGTEFPLELSVAEVPLHGRRMFTGIVRDITERKRVQRLKDEFISTVSHELRTPLTSIRGSLGLILGGAMGDVAEEARELIEIAARNTDRLSRLINDILDLEKIGSGKMEFHVRPLPLRAFLGEAIEANRSFAEQHRAHCVLIEPVPDADVMADPDRLMQVVTNLLSNAAKFSPESGEISVAAELRGERVVLSVKDRGEGIPEGFRDKIFEKFTQADNVSTRRVGGTGLGLSICKTIVEAMSGSIHFETETSRGTTFFVELPVAAARATEACREPREKRVLVCEDDPDIGRLLAMVLGQHGYAAEVAATAEEARTRLQKTRFHAMTLDLGLPDQDGMALLREIRTDPATSSLPVIVVTASGAGERERLNGDAKEIVDWIQKPIDDARLLDALGLALRRTRNARPRLLHLEDDPDIRRVVEKLVGDRTEVVPASTLREARERLGSGSFDLVIVDVGLPDGSGLELLGELDPRVPVILFSAQEVDEAVSEAVEAMLVKSEVTPDRLLETILSLLRAQG